MAFETKTVEKNGKSVVELIGELDIYVSQEFKEKILKKYGEEKKDIYFDFEKLEYIDSTGLGALVEILRNLKKDDKKVYLENVNHGIRKLFKITKLDEMFEFIGE